MLACADIEEGVALRDAGVTIPILVFGALSVSDLGGVFDARADADGLDAGRGARARSAPPPRAACGSAVISRSTPA